MFDEPFKPSPYIDKFLIPDANKIVTFQDLCKQNYEKALELARKLPPNSNVISQENMKLLNEFKEIDNKCSNMIKNCNCPKKSSQNMDQSEKEYCRSLMKLNYIVDEKNEDYATTFRLCRICGNEVDRNLSFVGKTYTERTGGWDN